MSNSIRDVLKTTTRTFAAELKKKSPYRTGRLKRSIKAIIRGNKASISMLDYGYFLNRGTRTQKHKGWINIIKAKTIKEAKSKLVKAMIKKIKQDAKRSNSK